MRPFQPASMLPHHPAIYQVHYSFMGERLTLRTNHPNILAAATETFGASAGEAGGSAEPLRISLFVDSEGESGSAQAPFKPSRPIVHTQDHLLFISAGSGNTAVADLAGGQAFGVITPSLAQAQEFVRYAFLEALSQAMLGLSRQFVAVHAACVVKEGISVLLPGPAGTGKSTLAYACARRGYRVLSEDVVQVDFRSRPLKFWGMPRKFHLLEDAKRFFPELHEEKLVSQINGEEKLVIDLEQYFPGSTVASSRPGLVVFLKRGGSRTECQLTQVDPRESMNRLEVIWSWTTGWEVWMTERIPDLLPLGAYELHATEAPDQIVDHLDRLLLSVRQKQQ